MLGPDGRNGYQANALSKIPRTGAPPDDQLLEQRGTLGDCFLQALRCRIPQPGEQGCSRGESLGSEASLRCAQLEVQDAMHSKAAHIRMGRPGPNPYERFLLVP